MTQTVDVKELLKKINEDGFNVYMMLNRLKKMRKNKDNLPDQVIIEFSRCYWKYKPADKKGHWPYFLKTLDLIASQWHANNQIQQSQKYKTDRMPQALKDIMKGIS